MNVRYVLNPSQTLRLSRVKTDTKDISSAYLQHIYQSITTPLTDLKNMTYNVLFQNQHRHGHNSQSENWYF